MQKAITTEQSFVCIHIYIYIYVGEHLPLHSDGVLLHPDTMRECEMVIASPVVVSPFEDVTRSKQVVCRAWPLPQLPLDGW